VRLITYLPLRADQVVVQGIRLALPEHQINQTAHSAAQNMVMQVGQAAAMIVVAAVVPVLLVEMA